MKKIVKLIETKDTDPQKISVTLYPENEDFSEVSFLYERLKLVEVLNKNESIVKTDGEKYIEFKCINKKYTKKKGLMNSTLECDGDEIVFKWRNKNDAFLPKNYCIDVLIEKNLCELTEIVTNDGIELSIAFHQDDILLYIGALAYYWKRIKDENQITA